MASSSSSSSFISLSCVYDVFLSFRGEDTRKGFVDHLYAELDRNGIIAFKDDERLRGGELISHKLLEAVEQSRSAIIIFSKDYASSSWCLDELVKIMDRKETQGLAVYPVFYDVAPYDVRRQRGTFGEGFARAAKRKADKADVWRKVLRDAADLSGYDVQNTAGGNKTQGSEPDIIVGERSRRGSNDRNMGGSGKTTVATVAFDELSKEFNGASFLESVREASQKFGLPHLQKNILSDVFMEQNLNISRVFQGTQMLSQRLGCKKVLIVLDDVDHTEQLDALAGNHGWFGKGSRIIITTRNEQLLVAHKIDKIYKQALLDKDEANQLFNIYAFKKYNRMEGYDELSLHFIRYAAGLPLTLKVLGSFLCDRGPAEWKSALKRLENIPEKETFGKLKISYDGLEDIDKKIFLDIACFFKGWKKDEVVRILDSCEFDPVIGLSNLQKKTLITFPADKVQMHDLIQEMGRKIATQDAPDEPGKHSRLWHSKDISSVLEKNMGTEAIEAIVETNNVYEQVPSFDTKAFESMKKLRILYIHRTLYSHNNSHNKRGCVKKLEYLPDELRWLRWYGYPHESLPQSFHAPKLVGHEMVNSNIDQLWHGAKRLEKLKFLDLSQSDTLIRTPDFNDIPNLETLLLSSCTCLEEVHPSIGDLQKLVSLDLRECASLKNLPETIGRLKNLKMLHLGGCPIGTCSIRVSILILSGLSCLRELNLSRCRLSETDIHVDIGKLSFLEKLDLGSNEFSALPSTISQLSRLKILKLTGCKLLKALPELPSNIAILMADGCESLECMEGLPKKCEWLWKLSLRGCLSLISCDHNCRFNNKENKSSSISSRQSKSVSNAERGYCPKHSKLTQVVTSMLLQGRALVNHRLSITYSAGIMDPWMWFDGQQIIKGNRFVLKLPPNWQNETTGFAMCVAFHSEHIKNRVALEITIPIVVNNQSVNIPLSCPEPRDLPDHKDVWIGYISFKLLRRSCEGVIRTDLIDKATQLFLTFGYKAEFCAAHLVDYKEDMVYSEATAFCPSISSGLQQKKDPNFAASTKLYCRKRHEIANDMISFVLNGYIV